MKWHYLIKLLVFIFNYLLAYVSVFGYAHVHAETCGSQT